MLRNPCQFGRKKAGFTKKTRAGGFSGIVAIIWVEEFLVKTKDKSKDGKQSIDISLKSLKIAERATSRVALANAKQYFTGHMIVGSFNFFPHLTLL